MENPINPEIYGPFYRNVEDNSKLKTEEAEQFAIPLDAVSDMDYNDYTEEKDEDLKYVDGWMVRR